MRTLVLLFKSGIEGVYITCTCFRDESLSISMYTLRFDYLHYPLVDEIMTLVSRMTLMTRLSFVINISLERGTCCYTMSVDMASTI